MDVLNIQPWPVRTSADRRPIKNGRLIRSSPVVPCGLPISEARVFFFRAQTGHPRTIPSDPRAKPADACPAVATGVTVHVEGLMVEPCVRSTPGQSSMLHQSSCFLFLFLAILVSGVRRQIR